MVLFYNERLIKEHVVPSNGYRKTDPNDFPENLRAALDKGMPHYLQTQATKIGTSFHELVRTILTPNAFMNMRRAQGIIEVAKKYPAELVEEAAFNLLSSIRTSPRPGNGVYFSPKYFKASIEKLIQSKKEPQQLKLSDETQSFVRDIGYFDHSFK